MSDRFICAWQISTDDLESVVRGGQLTSRKVLGNKANRRARTDVFMTLDEDDGKAIATSALDEIFAGTLDAERDYDYARVIELIANVVGRPLTGQIEQFGTYHLPKATDWNPLLAKCGMPKLAKLWGTTNFAFPWRGKKARSDWPIITLMSPAELVPVAKELKSVTKKHVLALPPKLMVDHPENLKECQDELWLGLQQLRKWVHACAGKVNGSLLLKIDGDE